LYAGENTVITKTEHFMLLTLACLLTESEKKTVPEIMQRTVLKDLTIEQMNELDKHIETRLRFGLHEGSFIAACVLNELSQRNMDKQKEYELH
jgi:hypothetical protein